MRRFGIGDRRVAGRAGRLGITKGAVLTMAPIDDQSTTTQAHGLGAEPTFFTAILECTTADNAWDDGDRININASALVENSGSTSDGFVVAVDATNVRLLVDGGALFIPDEDDTASIALTVSSWKIEITPYLVS